MAEQRELKASALRNRRNELGMSAEEFAEYVNNCLIRLDIAGERLTSKKIYGLEHKRFVFSDQICKLIATALDLSVQEFLASGDTNLTEMNPDFSSRMMFNTGKIVGLLDIFLPMSEEIVQTIKAYLIEIPLEVEPENKEKLNRFRTELERIHANLVRFIGLSRRVGTSSTSQKLCPEIESFQNEAELAIAYLPALISRLAGLEERVTEHSTHPHTSMTNKSQIKQTFFVIQNRLSVTLESLKTPHRELNEVYTNASRNWDESELGFDLPYHARLTLQTRRMRIESLRKLLTQFSNVLDEFRGYAKQIADQCQFQNTRIELSDTDKREMNQNWMLLADRGWKICDLSQQINFGIHRIIPTEKSELQDIVGLMVDYGVEVESILWKGYDLAKKFETDDESKPQLTDLSQSLYKISVSHTHVADRIAALLKNLESSEV